jgi:hypothetical protein
MSPCFRHPTRRNAASGRGDAVGLDDQVHVVVVQRVVHEPEAYPLASAPERRLDRAPSPHHPKPSGAAIAAGREIELASVALKGAWHLFNG